MIGDNTVLYGPGNRHSLSINLRQAISVELFHTVLPLCASIQVKGPLLEVTKSFGFQLHYIFNIFGTSASF